MLTTHSSRLRLALLSVLASSTLGLTACQSVISHDNPSPNHSPHLSLAIQPQLFKEQNNSSSSAVAKTSLLSALDSHLANEHMSMSYAQYQVRPFIAGDSVDKGSRSLLQTILATMSYHKQQQQAEEDEMLADYIETIEQEIADGEIEEMDDDEILAEAESRYEDYQEYYANDKLSGKVKSGLSSYMKMTTERAEEQQSSTDELMKSNSLKDFMRKGNMDMILKMLYRTPEQVEAMQYYQMQHLTFSSLGQHLPAERKYQSVYSVDANSPTQQISIQVPLAIDFDDGVLTLDPSAFMPVVALVNDAESTPLPNEMKSHTVAFSLPDKVLEQVPADVIYDAIIHSIHVAFKEMDSEYFTAVDSRTDGFAKEVGAKQVIKVHWGAKQMGEFLGRAVKSIGQDIQQNINQHPEQYKDRKQLIEVINKWQLISQDFQSKDVGGLMQLFEAIAPINFNKTAYYYLNNNHKLIAYQVKSSIGSEVYGWTMDGIQRTQYASSADKKIQKNALYPLFNEDFGINATTSLNGNQWLSDKKKLKSYQRQARSVRYDYEELSETEEDNADVVSADVISTDADQLIAEDNEFEVTDSEHGTQQHDESEYVSDGESEEYRKTKEAFLKFQSGE